MIITQTTRSTSHSMNVNIFEGFSFSNGDEVDVYKAFHSIKSNAVGLDALIIKFIKLIAPVLSPSLTCVFNNITMRSTFPSSWKIVNFIPIPKKFNSGSYDHRPFATLHFRSKVFEKFLSSQIIEYINSYSLSTELQLGFRKFRSCLLLYIRFLMMYVRASMKKSILF